MVFGFLKRKNKVHKKQYSPGKTLDEVMTEEYKKSFWWNLLTDSDIPMLQIPFVDIAENRSNASYLKDVVKNEDDVHRRAISVYILFREHNNTVNGTFGEFWRELVNELGVDSEGLKDVRSELNHLLMMQKNNEFLLLRGIVQ